MHQNYVNWHWEIQFLSWKKKKEEKSSQLSKATSYRETVKGKKRTLSTLDETLNKLEDEFRQLK